MANDIEKIRGVPFTPETGRLAAIKRWEVYDAAIQEGLIAKVKEETGREITTVPEAVQILAEVLTEKALEGNVSALKEIARWAKLLPQEVQLVDKRSVEISYNFYTFATEQEMQAYIEDLAEHDEAEAEFVRLQVEKQGSPPYEVRVQI